MVMVVQLGKFAKNYLEQVKSCKVSDFIAWKLYLSTIFKSFLGGSDGSLPAKQETQFDPWVWKIPWRREWLPTPVFLPGEFHGQRNLVGYSPWCHKRVRHNWVTFSTTTMLLLHRTTRIWTHAVWLQSL